MILITHNFITPLILFSTLITALVLNVHLQKTYNRPIPPLIRYCAKRPEYFKKPDQDRDPGNFPGTPYTEMGSDPGPSSNYDPLGPGALFSVCWLIPLLQLYLLPQNCPMAWPSTIHRADGAVARDRFGILTIFWSYRNAYRILPYYLQNKYSGGH